MDPDENAWDGAQAPSVPRKANEMTWSHLGRRGAVALLAAVLTAGCTSAGSPGAEGTGRGAGTEFAGRDGGPPGDDGGGSGEEGGRPDRGRSDHGAGDLRSLQVSTTTIVEGLSAPLGIENAADGSGRMFVVEQEGTVRVVQNGELEPEPFLDISHLTVASGEQGLLGLAFHPRFEDNGRLFVNYTDRQGDTVVAEYRVKRGAPRGVQPAPAGALLHIDQPYPNHNGGALAFGPDGFLYIATGDGGSGGDPLDNGQSLETLLGKLLRIDVDERDSDRPYGIPRDNPFVGRADVRPEIWAFGLRNPWRFSFDGQSGDLWIGDVGQDNLEEINRSPASAGGLNYGWNTMEGSNCYEPSQGCSRAGLVLPVAEYSHDLGCSVTGGYVYRGSQHPTLRGAYLFADFCSGTVWGIDSAGSRPQAPIELLGTGAQISSFGRDEDGELYLVDAAAGTLQRIRSTRG
jgi:glucose/arabinose dehydrogenase